MKKTIILTLAILIAVMPLNLAIISSGYSHSYDYYSVSFDKEGDAIVRAKLTIDNVANNPIDHLSLEVPGRNIVFYDVFQESKSGRQCIRYKTEPVCVQYDEYYNCEKYEDQKTCDYWSASGPTVTRIENLTEQPASESSMLNIPLTYPIGSGDSSSITIVYKIPRSASKRVGAFYFNFKTIIDPKAKLVDNVRVSVNVEQDLHLKGTLAEVNYREDFFGELQAEAAMSKMAEPAYYEDFSRQITQSSGYVKTASNLDPWESFTVKGVYSESYFRIHMLGTSFTILIILAVIALITYGIMKAVKHIKASSPRKKPEANHHALLVIITSAIQAITLTFCWFVVWFILNNLTSWVGYRYASVLGFFLIILFALLMLSLFFVPPIILGIKKGMILGIIAMALTIVWLTLIVILIIILLAIFSFSSYVPLLRI